MNDQPTFSIMDTVPVRVELMPECHSRYFIVAYWPGGHWWKIFGDMYDTEDCDSIKKKLASLQDKGWTYIHVMRLNLFTHEYHQSSNTHT